MTIKEICQNDAQGKDEKEKDERIRALEMESIAKTGNTGWLHIMLYNSFLAHGNGAPGLAKFVKIHQNLMTLHGCMAGFQYIAFENSLNNTVDYTLLFQMNLLVRFLGFGISLLGTILSLITVEYIQSIMEESSATQVAGCLKYNHLFLISDELAVYACVLLVSSANLSLYDVFPQKACIALHGLSVGVIIAALYIFKVMVLDRQTYGDGRKLYHHDRYMASLKNKKK